jgi:dTDP-4-amino-4,6-dideoxygalactose transaminase
LEFYLIVINSFIQFAKADIGSEEISEVISTLNSGWLTSGNKVIQFESDFESFLGSNLYALAVNSATAGLHLALEAIGVGVGDEVITTTHTFTATAEVIRYLGAHPVFVDIDPLTLCIDVDAIEKVISPRTKAILPVHFAGLSADMSELLKLAKKYSLRVIEDAAHALPATKEKKLVGSLNSDITVFSFYANKTITTGEGGMLVTRSLKIANHVKTMRLHGINRDAFNRFTAKVPSWYYEVIAPGFKYNMTDISASIGIHQLKKAYQFQTRREQIALTYNQFFRDLPLVLPPMPINGDMHSWHLYVIQLKDRAFLSRDVFIEKMFQSGIGCSVHYIPLHLQPYWRDTYNLSPNMFPISQKVYEQSVSLPIYSKMSDEEVQKVISTVRSLLI